MKYILTKEELDNLVSLKDFNLQKEATAKLKAKVLELSKFVCIYKGIEGTYTLVSDGYCDRCPVSCLSFKPYETAILFCDKHQNFSK